MTQLLLTADAGWLLQRQTAPDDWDLLGQGPLALVPTTEREARRVGLALGAPRGATAERVGDGWRLSWRSEGRPRDGAEVRASTSVWLTPAEIALADEYRAAHGLRSRGEAIRRMAFPARVIG